MKPVPPPLYQTPILDALHRIQHQHGYLPEEALREWSAETGTPLYRLNAVASFFPHFRKTEPPRVTLRVCRDMACHMNGAGDMIAQLAREIGSGDVCVEGVSCLGRCDGAVAACVSVHQRPTHRGNGHGGGHGHDTETFLTGCTVESLKDAAAGFGSRVGFSPPDRAKPVTVSNADRRADTIGASEGSGGLKPTLRGQRGPHWQIDPYAGGEREYAAVHKALAARSAALDRAVGVLQSQFGWTPARAGLFRQCVESRLIVDFDVDDDLLDAVRAFETESDWAAGPELGGWADAILAELDAARADLRGMGGAGIPATQKWRDVRDAVRSARKRGMDDRAFIIVNGDESEPGTFKDRELLLQTPHVVIEGVLLACLITDATQGFIYIRHEYPQCIAACEAEIRRAESLGVCGMNASAIGRMLPVSVFVSPGGYICGEQSALVEAMSDRRAEPRNMPPKLETNGLDDRPTLVSNVETYAWVPYIWLKGGEAYASEGTNTWRGRRFFSVSGDVARPGVYEVPMGITLRELIHGDQYCQGMKDGVALKAFAPSGPSGGFLPAKLTATSGLPREHTKKKEWQALAQRRGFDPNASELDILDLELELNLFRALSPTQALGAGLVVYGEGRNMLEQAVNAIEFFRNESCGKCVPCRIGSQKLATLGGHLRTRGIAEPRWKAELLPIVQELGDTMVMTSICGLGRSVPIPLRTVINFFPQDVQFAETGCAGSSDAQESTPSPLYSGERAGVRGGT